MSENFQNKQQLGISLRYCIRARGEIVTAGQNTVVYFSIESVKMVLSHAVKENQS